MQLPFEITERRGIWYLAHPYSHPASHIREDRWIKGLHMTGLLMAAGVMTHNPIHATHDIGKVHKLPYEHEFWIEYNRHFIDGCVGMLLLTLPGWQESRGVRQEIQYCIATGKPIWTLSMRGDCACYT